MDESGHTDHLYLFDFNTEVSDSYGVVGQPETIIIDEDGMIHKGELVYHGSKEQLYKEENSRDLNYIFMSKLVRGSESYAI